jgi:hypothetical protein
MALCAFKHPDIGDIMTCAVCATTLSCMRSTFHHKPVVFQTRVTPEVVAQPHALVPAGAPH